jgi:hypothetical protein
MKKWTVMRWSGRDCDASRKAFAGTEEKARAKYAKLYRAMGQGAVELIDGEGRTWIVLGRRDCARDCDVYNDAHA